MDSDKKRKVSSLIDANSLIFDCWGVIVTFFESPRDFLNLCLAIKDLYEYIKISPFFCENIEFRPSTLPSVPVVFVLKLSVTDWRMFWPWKICMAFPNLSCFVFDLKDQSPGLSFEATEQERNRVDQLRNDIARRNNIVLGKFSSEVQHFGGLKYLRTLLLSVDSLTQCRNSKMSTFILSGLSNLEDLSVGFPQVIRHPQSFLEFFRRNGIGGLESENEDPVKWEVVLEDLPRLKSLDLRQCILKEYKNVATSFSSLEMSFVAVSFSESVPEFIGGVKSLQVFGENNIRSSNFGDLERLRYVCFNGFMGPLGSMWRRGDDDGESFSNRDVYSMDFTGVVSSVDSLTFLSENISNLPKLREISLLNNSPRAMFARRNMRHAQNVRVNEMNLRRIENLPNLRSIKLYQFEYDEKKFLVFNNLPNLEELLFSRCILAISIDYSSSFRSMRDFSLIVQSGCLVKFFDLQGNELRHVDMPKLSALTVRMGETYGIMQRDGNNGNVALREIIQGIDLSLFSELEHVHLQSCELGGEYNEDFEHLNELKLTRCSSIGNFLYRAPQLRVLKAVISLDDNPHIDLSACLKRMESLENLLLEFSGIVPGEEVSPLPNLQIKNQSLKKMLLRSYGGGKVINKLTVDCPAIRKLRVGSGCEKVAIQSGKPVKLELLDCDATFGIAFSNCQISKLCLRMPNDLVMHWTSIVSLGLDFRAPVESVTFGSELVQTTLLTLMFSDRSCEKSRLVVENTLSLEVFALSARFKNFGFVKLHNVPNLKRLVVTSRVRALEISECPNIKYMRISIESLHTMNVTMESLVALFVQASEDSSISKQINLTAPKLTALRLYSLKERIVHSTTLHLDGRRSSEVEGGYSEEEVDEFFEALKISREGLTEFKLVYGSYSSGSEGVRRLLKRLNC